VKCSVVTGSATVFAAGADLNLLVDKGAQAVADIDLGRYWAPVAGKPQARHRGRGRLRAGRGLRARPDVRLHRGGCHGALRPARTGGEHHAGAGGTQRLVRTLGKQVPSLC
jgi:hypothetical protein